MNTLQRNDTSTLGCFFDSNHYDYKVTNLKEGIISMANEGIEDKALKSKVDALVKSIINADNKISALKQLWLKKEGRHF